MRSGISTKENILIDTSTTLLSVISLRIVVQSDEAQSSDDDEHLKEMADNADANAQADADPNEFCHGFHGDCRATDLPGIVKAIVRGCNCNFRAI